MEQSVT